MSRHSAMEGDCPAEDPAPVLCCQQAWIGFERPVLGPLDFAIHPGQRLALTGPNGAGKSLLLKALTGRARLFGGTIERAPDARIGLLSQEHPRPSPWPLNGHDWLRALGARSPEEPFIRRLLPRRLDRLSGGQWQLLRLAAVVHAPADLLLLDEPANHLDAEVRDQAIRLLGRLREGTAVVMTSHDEDFLGASGFERIPLGALL
jgi:ATPase subunit of ABC transporter with duplicated ATPase domains